MKRSLVLVAAIAVIGGGIYVYRNSAKPAAPPPPVKVNFGYRPISPSLDFFVALEKGYFKDEGLELNLSVFRGSSDLTDALMMGKVDFASDLGMVTQLVPLMRRGEYTVKFISLDLDSLDSDMRGPVLVAKKEAKIKTIKDLKGKRIGIFPDINFRVFFDAVLKANGLSMEKDVTLLDIPPQEQMTGFVSVDAMLSLDPIIAGIEAKYGAKVLGDRLSARYIFDNFPAAASSVNSNYALDNPLVVEKVIRALSRGIDFVRTNPAETVDILAKYTNQPLEIAKITKPLKYAKHEEISVESLQKTCDYLKGLPWLNLEKSLDASQLVWQKQK